MAIDYTKFGGVLCQPGTEAHAICASGPGGAGLTGPIWNFGRKVNNAASLRVKQMLIQEGNPRSLYEVAPYLKGIGEGQVTMLSHRVRDAIGSFLRPQYQNRGTCVSRGAKRVADLCQALAKYFGASVAFEYISHAFIYGTCREYGGALGGNPSDENDDGAVGAWAAYAVNHDGNLRNTDTDPDDNDNDDTLACQWGAKGVPATVKVAGKLHRIEKVVPIKTYEEARDWIASGVGGVTVASNVGYEGTRDSNGVIRRSGNWSHQMCYTDQREDGTMKALLQCQSWGPDQPGGSYGSIEIPSYTWWTLMDDVNVQLAERDAFGFAWIDPWLADSLTWRP